MEDHKKRVFIPFVDSPTTLVDLLEKESYYKTLGQSFVFIQNRKTLADRLIEERMQLVREAFDVQRLFTHSQSIKSILKLASRKSSRYRGKPLLFLVDTTGVVENVKKFCMDVAKMKQSQCGVWVRGYVRDLDPKTLALFDAFFLFDMSKSEYEILRSVIKLTKKDIAELKAVSDNSAEKVLFFMNDKYQDNVPFVLKENPIILLI